MEEKVKGIREYLLGFDRDSLRRRVILHSGIFALCWIGFSLLLWRIDGRNILGKLLTAGLPCLLLFHMADLFPGAVVPVLRLKPAMEKCRREGRISDLIFDFETAEEFWDGSIRLGQWWIFCRGSGRLISYDEIVCCTRDGHMAKSRATWLAVLTDSDKLFCLCEIPGNGADVEDVLYVMKERNPEMEILKTEEI